MRRGLSSARTAVAASAAVPARKERRPSDRVRQQVHCFMVLSSLSLRGAKRRGNPHTVAHYDGDCRVASLLAMTSELYCLPAEYGQISVPDFSSFGSTTTSVAGS